MIYILGIFFLLLMNVFAAIKIKPLDIRHCVLFFISAIALSVIVLDYESKNYLASSVFFSCVFCFNFTFLYFDNRIKKSERRRYKKRIPRPIAIALTCIVVYGLASYHLIIGGIPLLSSNIFIDRFTHAGTGFFGIPGRMYQYGIYFAFFLSISSYALNRQNLEKKVAFISVITFSILLLANGNKGSIIQFFVCILIVSLLFARHDRNMNLSGGIPIPVVILTGLVSLGVFFVIANVQISLGIGDLYSNSFNALYKRVFEISGKAFVTSVYEVAPNEGYTFGRGVLRDSNFLLQKLVGNDQYYSTIQLVSSYVTGRNLFGNLFLVPVTITGFGYAYLEFGWIGSVVLSIFFGYLLSKLRSGLIFPRGVVYAAIHCYFLLLLFWLMTRGSLITTSLNMIGSLLFITFIYKLFFIMGRR